MAAVGARLRPADRLRARAEFERVFRRGLRLDGRLFLLVAAENEREQDRLGLVASRRLGPAVKRNRVKRVLRESFRRQRRDGDVRGLDLVVVAKPELLEATREDVDREFRERVRRAAARRGRAGARRAD